MAAVLDLPVGEVAELPSIFLADGGLLRFRLCGEGESEGIVAVHFASADVSRIGTSVSNANCECASLEREAGYRSQWPTKQRPIVERRNHRSTRFRIPALPRRPHLTAVPETGSAV